MSSSFAVRAEQVTKVYGTGPTAVRALDGVDLEVPRGEFLGIMGPSGSGKSTLLHCLAALDRVTGGRVWVGDTDLGSLEDEALTRLRRRVGFVFQAYNLVPTLTARENITLPLQIAGQRPDGSWIEQVIEVLEIGDRLGHRPAELSGGQQQRVAVARALATRPEVIFADEPSGNLDSRAGAQVLGFLRRAVDDLGETVVMVTHDPSAAAFSDRVVFLADGRVVDELAGPTPEGILDRIKALEL